ncbi:MAG TPA: hypothetical protein VLT62_03160 [Candidatus Methylomirabilis sp.]|nr:hypothetical protein [Candidatus Methylomirabilis sp.]
MNTTRANNRILYALVIGFLRGLVKGFVLTAEFLVARDYLAHCRRDQRS